MNRLKKIDEIRNKLHRKQLSLGSWIQIPHPSIAEIIGGCGYDWVAIDLEHGSVSSHQLPDIFRALELGNTLPLARVAASTNENCCSALDAGAGGLILPKIESADHLESLIMSSRWPPAGIRGVGFSRANLFGKCFESYKEEAQAPLIIAMIESKKGVENIDNILQVPGLDAIFIGPYDLSASYGMTGLFEDARFLSIKNLVFSKTIDAGISPGIHLIEPDQNQLNIHISLGYQFIAFSIDTVMLNRSASLGPSNL